MRVLETSLALVLCAVLPACGQRLVQFPLDSGVNLVTDGGSGPSVVSTIPANLATAVALNTTVRATFSTAMDSASVLAPNTFTLSQGTTPVAATVTYAGTTATLTPGSNLGANLTYTATITTYAADLAGRSLAANYIWTFSTAQTNASPTVITTTPLNNALNVSINVRPTATFSNAMDPTTLTATTFTLQQGLTNVLGTVSYNALTSRATFAPDAPLGLNLQYTATITTGARDTGGNAIAANYVWRFTTSACSLAPVVLGAAGSFGVLAASTITNTGPTRITGDIGVSPGTAITGFPPGTLTGTQHPGDPTAATGNADLTTAYNDAAGRTLCPIVVAGDIGGRTLVPGLYRSTGSLSVTSANLVLDAQGDVNAVFIFQMAFTLTTTAGRRVILSGGADAANIFWQVGSSATLGASSALQGTIMADQSITVGTGATLNGRALARVAAVTLDNNTIVVPP